MGAIEIGRSARGAVRLDLDVLLRTRLLVQANSGGGKSWILRRLAEQMFGKVPVVIVDPEGEFATLRERHGYVLVGKGGETPADPRSAALVARKLLELRASAVCDLYDLKPQARHQWVRLFLEAMVDAPKTLWRPVVVMVDEAHVYIPEKGQGESEASEAVRDLVTRGRKRGFCPILYTQRLAKLSKNVSAEMLNRLVGMTFEDVDLERAADLLSVTRCDREAFFLQMKTLEPGQFWAFGRAVAKERVLVKVGPVRTTHPEPGAAAYGAGPPPAPEKVKALLPKFADLPKEAERRARTEEDLRAEIRSLKAMIAALPAPQPAKREVVTVERPVISAAQLVRIERALSDATRAAGAIQRSADHLRGFSDMVADGVRKIEQAQRCPDPPDKASALARFLDPFRLQARRRPDPSAKASPPPPRAPSPHRAGEVPPPEPVDGATLGKPERAALAVLAQHNLGCTAGKLALLAGYRWSGGFRNALSRLRSLGYITGSNGGVMAATRAGLDAIAGRADPLPKGRELLDYWLRHDSFGNAERKALAALVESPGGLTGAELAQAAGYEWSGGFRNALSRLRTAGVLVGKNTERMRLCDMLLEAREQA